jgi:predicted  nucleic acid-binding Zn-ribbon protein
LRELDDQDARDDPVIAELRKLVDIREEQFANLKALNETGQASGISMRNAQAEVAQARIEMLRARRSAAEVANGPLIRELNNELSRLIIRDAELKATHDALDERTEKLEELIAAADQRALLTQQSDALRNVIGVLEDKMRQLRNEANQPRGPITIKPLAEALPKPQR